MPCKDLYYVSTPYNLFVALMIRMGNSNSSDLIISDFSSINEGLYKRIISEKIFDNVYFVEQRKFEEFNHNSNSFFFKLIHITKRMINIKFRKKKIYKKYFNKIPVLKYNRIYMDTPNFVQKVIYYRMKSINKDLEYYRIDCGIESYYLINKESLIKRIFESNKNMMQVCKAVYLLNDSFKIFNEISTIDLCKDINKIDVDKYNRVFDYLPSDNKLFDYQYIYFDQLLDFVEWNKIQEKMISNLVFLKNELCIKIHPRRNDVLYSGFDVFNSKTTMEVLVLNNPDVDYNNMVFISPFSTAAFLPKMMFNKEPYIIFTLDILKINMEEYSYVVKMVEKLIDSYSNKNKIFIPKTLEEFEEIIKSVGKQRGEFIR